MRLVSSASCRQRDLFMRSIYVAILAAVLFFGMLTVTAPGGLSLRDLAAGSAGVFTILAMLQLILICLLTPVFMAGAIAREANPRTWDILLSTPMSPLQIVLGNLFGRLFFIIALLLGSLPLMIVTQFFGGVPLDTILLTQLVAVCLALVIAASAIAMSVTRTAGRRAAVSFFVVIVFYLITTFVIDSSLRTPVSAGSNATWTTILTPLNPFLVLKALLQPAGYVIPESSLSPWPIGWAVTHPVAAWCWFTTICSTILIGWSSINVRKLGNRQVIDGWWKRLSSTVVNKRGFQAVSGNPIAWRERVTRHRNIGSLLGRWGFAAVSILTLIVLTTLYVTRYMTPDTYRLSIMVIVCSELVIVTFAAISLSASAIAKEREDGSLDLLLTTSITPKLYLGGKVHGLAMHLLPMVLAPCVTMMAVGLLVILDADAAVVTDQLVQNRTASAGLEIPLALYLPAFLTPVVVIPYMSFCIVLGLLWSMRSKGSIGAMVPALIIVFIVTASLSMCLIPMGISGTVGSIFSSLSPIENVFVMLSPATRLPSILDNGIGVANITLGITSVISGLLWCLISWGLIRSMSTSFVPTVRRLAGIQ